MRGEEAERFREVAGLSILIAGDSACFEIRQLHALSLPSADIMRSCESSTDAERASLSLQYLGNYSGQT